MRWPRRGGRPPPGGARGQRGSGRLPATPVPAPAGTRSPPSARPPRRGARSASCKSPRASASTARPVSTAYRWRAAWCMSVASSPSARSSAPDRHAQAERLGEVAHPEDRPIAGDLLELLDQPAGGGVVAVRVLDEGAGGDGRHQDLRVPDLPGSGQELLGERLGVPRLAAIDEHEGHVRERDDGDLAAPVSPVPGIEVAGNPQELVPVPEVEQRPEWSRREPT